MTRNGGDDLIEFLGISEVITKFRKNITIFRTAWPVAYDGIIRFFITVLEIEAIGF